jgi:hypothetical protein
MNAMSLFWELYQHSRINDARDTAARARSDSASATRSLETRIESLTLTTMAMWSILEERLGVTEQELADRVREIDLRDGRLDGKASTTLTTCASCGRSYAAKRASCIYCGEPNPARAIL